MELHWVHPEVFREQDRSLAEERIAELEGGKELDLPAIIFSIATVHTEQIRGEDRRFVTPRARSDLHDDVPAVPRIRGE